MLLCVLPNPHPLIPNPHPPPHLTQRILKREINPQVHSDLLAQLKAEL